MATSVSRKLYEPRPGLRKQTTTLTSVRTPSDPRRKSLQTIEMSPEAKHAMLLTREDTKENMALHRQKTFTGVKSTNNNANKNKGGIGDRNRNTIAASTGNATKHSDNNASDARTLKGPGQRKPPSNSRPPEPPRVTRKVTVSSSAVKAEATARSRSTLSHTDKACSASDHNDSSYTGGHSSTNKGKVNSNNSLYNNGSYDPRYHNYSNATTSGNLLDGEEDDYDDFEEDGSDNNNNNDAAEESDEGETGTSSGQAKSFVLALDRALEDRCISRLRGDITDTAGLSQPGKVRALDGGRLANAQEVVVNVCHGDDREVVFHDDDEESLDCANTISQIRVNIWMEYNAEFQPEDLDDDLDFSKPSAEEEKEQKQKTQLRVPSAVRRNTNRTLTTPRTSSQSRNAATNKSDIRERPPSGRRDSNNNRSNNINAAKQTGGSAGSNRSKTGSVRDNSATRANSSTSAHGNRRGSKDSRPRS